MNIILNIFALIGVSIISFFIFQLIWTMSNKSYINNFNAVYGKLEYSFNPNFVFNDNTIYDPNIDVTDVKEKFRCVFDTRDAFWYSLSKFGYISDSSISKTSIYTTEDDCILNSPTFRTNTFVIYDACNIEIKGYDCEFIQKNI